LLNYHTLDLASIVDDVAVHQVVFNLAKTAENQYALPSQVQIPSGQVSARTSVTPTITTPLNTALTSTSQVASQVAAASGAVTTTSTDIGADQRVGTTGGVSGVMEDLENWNVNPVQDPEQLRRLQLLYQYGAKLITAQRVLCLYPVPELPEKAAAGKSDLQTLETPSSGQNRRETLRHLIPTCGIAKSRPTTIRIARHLLGKSSTFVASFQIAVIILLYSPQGLLKGCLLGKIRTPRS
jgi:hypothetical protein